MQLNIGNLECQANGDQGVTQEVPFPEALISTIGQKHNFCVKVTKHNLDGKSRSLTSGGARSHVYMGHNSFIRDKNIHLCGLNLGTCGSIGEILTKLPQ